MLGKLTSIFFLVITLTARSPMAQGLQSFPTAGIKVSCPCKLVDNAEFREVATRVTGKRYIRAAYFCIANENDPNRAAIYNLNVYDESELYREVPASYYAMVEKEYLNSYAEGLRQAGWEHRFINFQGVRALEYTFDQMGLPTRAIVFIRNKRSYLIQVGTFTNLASLFPDLKNSFRFE